MPCASFEDLIADYPELAAAERADVDSHVAACAGCREYLETIRELDAGLEKLYSGAQVSPALQRAVFSRMGAEARMGKPSPLPEVLDFIGYAGIIGAIAWLAPLLPDFQPVFHPTVVLSAAIAGGSAVWAGLRCYSDLKQ